MSRAVLNVPCVSLVPTACRKAQSRERRARGWAVTIIAATLILLGLFATRAPSRRAVNEIAARLSYAETGRAAIQKQLELARVDQQVLAARLLVLSGLNRPQRWPARLAEILAAAPEDVLLTSLRVEPSAESAPAILPAIPTPTSAPVAGARSAATVTTAKPPSHVVRVAGQAASNDLLQRFVAALRESGNWISVSTQQLSVGEGAASGWLAFELECRPRESMP